MTPSRPQSITRRQFLLASALAGAGLAASGAQGALAAPPMTGAWVHSPILMYHYVDYLPTNADTYRIGLTVSPEMFEAHLDALVAGGYSVMKLADMWNAIATGAPLPPKPVTLTFDDGYDSAYRFALPALQKRNMTGMFFIITGQVGQFGYVTWPQLVEMQAAGMEIGNHTVHHPDLWWLNTTERMAEIDGAAQTLATQLGARPQFFSYPIGHYNSYIADIVRKTGHLAAVGTHFGTLHTATYPYWLDRVRIDNTVTAESLPGLIDVKL